MKTGERIFFPFFFLFRFIRDDDFIFKIIKKKIPQVHNLFSCYFTTLHFKYFCVA